MGQWQSATRKMNNHYQSAGEGMQAGQWFNSAMVNGERCYSAPLYLSPSYSSYENMSSDSFRAYSWLDYNALRDIVADTQTDGSRTIFAKICSWKEEELMAAVWSTTGLTTGTLNGETVTIPFVCPLMRPTVTSEIVAIAIIDNNYISQVPSWLSSNCNNVNYFTNFFIDTNGIRQIVPTLPDLDNFTAHHASVLQKATTFPSGWEGTLYDSNTMLRDCGVSYGGYGEVGKQAYQNNDLALDGRVSYWNSGVYGAKVGNEFQTVRLKTGFLPVVTTDIIGNRTYANSNVFRGFVTQITGNIYFGYRGALGSMYYNQNGGKVGPATVSEWLLNNEPFGAKMIEDGNGNIVGNIYVFVNNRIKSIRVQDNISLIS